MWRGYDQALTSYALYVCDEWIARNYVSTINKVFEDFLATCPDWDDSLYPPWFGDERFHSSHRAALLAKDPVWYGKFGWTEEPKINYWWPIKETAA